MSLEFDVIFIELQHNDYSIYVLLGNSWNYMPPILLSSSAKHTTTQIF